MKPGLSKFRAFIYFTAIVSPIVAVLFCYEFLYRYPIWLLRAFRVPSSSMCPTICNGERVLAEMQHDRPYVPKRGDVVLLEYGPDRVLFTKRIIGLPGDVVVPGPDDTILVNGEPWRAPAVCAKPPVAESKGDRAAYASFAETHVPPGELFVIGDNLYNSMDSRISQFEPVTPERVIGRPVMIYWSPEIQRIGCPIR